MKLLRDYRKVDYYEVAKGIQKYLELDWSKREEIEEYLRFSPYLIVSFEKTKKSSPLFRLTILFYVIYWCLLVLVMPFKWIFTGNGHYKYEGRLLKFLRKWNELLSF